MELIPVRVCEFYFNVIMFWIFIVRINPQISFFVVEREAFFLLKRKIDVVSQPVPWFLELGRMQFLEPQFYVFVRHEESDFLDVLNYLSFCHENFFLIYKT